MGKTRIYRPETLRREIVSTVPAANATYDWVPPALPMGSYRISLMITANVTGNSTVIAVHALDEDGNESTESLILGMSDLGNGVESLTLTGGSQEVHFLTVTTGPQTAALGQGPQPIQLPFGLRVKVTKGGATTAEPLKIVGTASRVA